MSPFALALTAVAAPAAVVVLLTLLPFLRRGRVAALLSLAAAATSLAAALALLFAQLPRGSEASVWSVAWMPGARGPLGEVGLRVDGVSTSMLAVVALVAFCVQLFSVRYLEGEPERAVGRYFTYQSLFIVSMGLLVLAPDLLQLFVGWELVGVTSYLLIGHYFRKPSAARAALKAFWVTKLADVGLLFALLVLWVQTGSFRWDAAVGTGVATAVSLLLLLAVAGKSAQFPLHVWLPNAMEGPTPVSALLHAATMVAAGVFLVVRAQPLFAAAPLTGSVMAHLGAFTAVFAALLALVQTDIKRMLAYSTSSQLGYMLAALGAGSALGGYFHLLTHAAFKALLFLAAGNVIHAVHTNEMTAMGGLGRRMRWTAAAFVVGALALSGVPGLSGAYSKELILESVAGRGLWLPLALLLAGVPLTAFYMGRAVLRTFFGAPGEAAAHAHEAPASMLVPLGVLAVPAVGAGLLGARLAGLVGTEYHFHFGPLSAAATLLALGGLTLAGVAHAGGAVALAVGAGLGRLEALARGAWVDRAWQLAFSRVLLPVGEAAAWVDRYVVDAAVNAVGALTLAAGRRVRVLQTGSVRDYLLVVVGAVVLLVLWGTW